MNKQNFAVLDIGSNSFHIMTANSPDGRVFNVIDREKAVLRLASKDRFGRPIIKEKDIKAAVRLIRLFKSKAEENNASIKAVATSAVREAINREEFIGRVASDTGVEIDVITWQKEAGYIYRAIRHFLHFKDHRILCVDVGGGSSEFITGSGDTPDYAVSLRMGAVRFTREFMPDLVTRKGSVAKAYYYSLGMIEAIRDNILANKYETAIFSSGSAKSVLTMAKGMGIVAAGSYSFSYENLLKVYDLVINTEDLKKRATIPGLEPRRADVVAAGVIILRAIFEKLEVRRAFFSEYALREGVLLELIQPTGIKL
ncbi:MAG: hypothetical protein LC102_08450 [Ignavibacteriales bacterium]|nr:MAG: hypothetical protein F9K26_12520 [Ignavibacteriaceae bacterium]MBW7872721.1 hypothetical protein [Ignavibacteria bacterium]MCZ2143441.1 hypothetical protein [Ignavibacteriales bacterium]MBV6444318.1 Exopolyphosphatase [Ignavibacteriaceae bacterium]MBZ0196804.1 hypothetical protein [Ignavibacteriaceae bacterium]